MSLDTATGDQVDPRAFVWACLLPSDVSYRVITGPSWIRNQLTALNSQVAGRQVAVGYGDWLRQRPCLDLFYGVVAINGLGGSASWLRESGFSYVRRFAVLPRLTSPRWFVPLDGPARVTHAALGLYTPFKPLAKLAQRSVQAAARTGRALWYRDEIVVAQREPGPIPQELDRLIPSRTNFYALSCGTPGPARKPTLAAIDDLGRVRAFSKLAPKGLLAGGSTRAQQLVANEARVLRSLNTDPLMRKLAPRLLASGETDGTLFLIQEPLLGRAGDRELSSDHLAFTRSLMSYRTKPAQSTEIIRTIHARINGLPISYSSLHGQAEAAKALLADFQVPRTVMHGDFVPWNLRMQHGRYSALDWEYANLDALPLLDELHHTVQVGFLLENQTVQQVIQSVLELLESRSGEFPTSQLHGLTLVYLIDLAIRRIEDGNAHSDIGLLQIEGLLDEAIRLASTTMQHHANSAKNAVAPW